MNGSEQFHIKLSKNFDKTQQKLIRDRYRKNQAGLVKFVELIQKFIKFLSIDPRPRPPLGHLEPWPKGSSRDGLELWKLEFKMPQLRGAAEQGRLIYLLDITKKEVVLVWIYTHAEFEKRPPDQNLKRLLLEIMENYEVSDKSNNLADSGDGETGEDKVGENKSNDS
ncbi:hypothetical protein D0A34_05970 [Microcoleus vaginatus PCC 9802]|uniref:hypothetical protein n=1 Tax=Microcoleus vaginatus TaxID=119532 RepID=UPI00020D1100|nr:hypothetical protein MicvaDRAFT_5250 [Microcoleus vaginatus FGP-2]UNU18479.1 hypothetical protein D0A34_05970 [Microcoleus vaginatus PCC 9802]